MTHEMWVGIFIGVLLGAFAPEWLKIATFFVAGLFSELALGAWHIVHNTRYNYKVYNSHSVHYEWPPWLIGVLGVVVALVSWHLARRRGLQHLGQVELRTRWTNVRGLSRWGW